MRRLLLIAALASTAACGGGGVPPDTSVHIGTATPSQTDPAQLVYLPLEDDTELTLEPGAQGGFHVFMHLRVEEAAIAGMGERPLVQRWARRVDTEELVSRAKRTHAFVPVPGDPSMLELDAAVPLFLCPTPIGIAVGDQPLNLRILISSDEDSPGLEAEVRFTPRCPKGDQAEFCRNICFG